MRARSARQRLTEKRRKRFPLSVIMATAWTIDELVRNRVRGSRQIDPPDPIASQRGNKRGVSLVQ